MNIGEVYFAQAESGPIKIGFSIDPKRRVANIQTTIPEKLTLIASARGTMRTEMFLHQTLKGDQITGEWYRPSHNVMLVVRAVRDLGALAFPDEYRAGDGDSAPEEVVLVDDFTEMCRDYCVAIAGPRVGSEKIHDLITRVSTITGLRRPTIRRIWYREHGAIHAFQYVRLKEVFEARAALDTARVLGALDRPVAEAAALGLSDAPDVEGSG